MKDKLLTSLTLEGHHIKKSVPYSGVSFSIRKLTEIFSVQSLHVMKSLPPFSQHLQDLNF